MGCDIHVWIEKRVDGTWKPVRVQPDDKGWSCAHDGSRWEDTLPSEWDIERWYPLFTALAGVRDDRTTEHVLGCQRVGGYFVDPLRGWPKDGGEDVRRERQMIEHSPSWLTLAELNAYDWDKNALYDFRDGHLQDMNKVATREGVSPDNFRLVFYFDS